MDRELLTIHITQDAEELVEQYETAASNERLWAKGSPDTETARMHEENAEHAATMAELYRRIAKCPEVILKLREET